jgi:hypothetical protein
MIKRKIKDRIAVQKMKKRALRKIKANLNLMMIKKAMKNNRKNLTARKMKNRLKNNNHQNKKKAANKKSAHALSDFKV